jgi:hypothetical protein
VATKKTKSNGTVLTERDVALLVSLYRYRYLSLPQVERLHFASEQTAGRRVRRLRAAGVVDDFRVPGVDERLVRLTPQGLALVAEHLRVTIDDLGDVPTRTRPKDYYFVRHFLATSDFRIALTEACEKRGDTTLLGFLPEHLGVRTEGGVQKYLRDVIADATRPGAHVTHTPDAVFALERAGRSALFFLEIDRGTEGISDPERGFAKTLRFYLNYLKTAGYQRYQTDFRVTEPFAAFRVLVVTSSEKRLENIRAVGGAMRFEPVSAKRFIWLAESAALTAGALLGPLWRSLDPTDERRYAIITDAER